MIFRKEAFADMLWSGLFSSLPSLESERLRLRRLTMQDAEDLFTVCSDPLVSRYVMWTTHHSVRETRSFLRGILRYYRADRPAPWGIELVAEQRLIGTIGFAWVNEDNASGEVGYSLGSQDWNQGYASEALRCVLEYGFHAMGLNRIEAQHDVRNPASGRVMEKAGMQLEGTLRERMYCKGEYITVNLYASLRREAEG